MRNLSANALTKIGTNLGTEPINIIEIQWVDGGSRVSYSDRDQPLISGRILSLSELDTVIRSDGNGDAQEISITLSDVDGDLKTIFDTHDIHKRPVWVYQWFEGLDLTDKFLLFTGTINTPVEWNESDRTLSFNVVTKIENVEVGFSAEEGQFPQIPDELIGQPWPLVFGTVLDLPALSINKTVQGTTQEGVGIISGADLVLASSTADASQDIEFAHSIALMDIQKSVLGIAAQQYQSLGGAGIDIANELLSQLNIINANQTAALEQKLQIDNQAILDRDTLISGFTNSNNIGPDRIHILGGEDFPQGIPVELEIGNGGFFTGIFDCQEFRILSRRHPENEDTAEEQASRANGTQTYEVPGQNFDISVQGPYGVVRQAGILLGGFVTNREQVTQIAQHYWAEAGSTVKLVTDQDQNFIVSIVPGTVKAVKAYKKFEGIRRLVNVPNNLWSSTSIPYGDVTAVMVTLTRQLSSISDQGWEDDIYVTFESDIGPNTVDIIEYLIQTYSNLAVDSTSFDAVRDYLDPFPSNFALFDKRQIIDLLNDIAFQCRCAAFVKDNTVYLKYLPATPTIAGTITASDIAHKTLSLSLTATEDLVTKMVVKWRPTYADDDERKIILRHNVQKYGVQEREFDWFIYNQPDIIRKAATFWLIRLANTWKRVEFKGFLNLLNVETFDGVTLNLDPFIGPVTSIVENATYDSSNRQISFQCWTPIKAGTTTAYKFAWPYDATGQFPTPEDLAGSDFSVTGDLPVGSLAITNACPSAGGIIVGGPNIVFVGPADRGDPTPSDTGFEAQDIVAPGTDFTLQVVPKPTPNLRQVYAAKYPKPDVPQLQQPQVIDIARTVVVDGDRLATNTTLSSILQFDEGEGAYAARRAYLDED